MSPEGIFKNIPRRLSPFLQDSGQELAPLIRWPSSEDFGTLASDFRQEHF